jgi:hypothetical protein
LELGGAEAGDGAAAENPVVFTEVRPPANIPANYLWIRSLPPTTFFAIVRSTVGKNLVALLTLPGTLRAGCGSLTRMGFVTQLHNKSRRDRIHQGITVHNSRVRPI